MLGDKFLYQLGNAGISGEDYYIFQTPDLKTNNEVTIKSVRQTSALYQGESRLNGARKNLKGDYVYTVTFSTEDNNNLDHINNLLKVMHDKPKLVFFYSYDDRDGLKWYFNYAEVYKHIRQGTKPIEPKGLGDRNYDISLRLVSPEFYECDPADLRIVNLTNFTSAQRFLNGAYTLNGSFTLGNLFDNTHFLISTLTQTQKDTFFGKSGKRTIPLFYNDRYFARNTLLGLSLELTAGTYFGLYIAGNNPITATTSSMNLQCSADCRVYGILFDPISKGESYSIKNSSNGSDIILTWNADLPNTNAFIYNSYYKSCFDYATGAKITPESGAISIDYTTDLLYFDGLITENVFAKTTTQNLIVQKNTSTDKSIFIKNLKTYH